MALNCHKGALRAIQWLKCIGSNNRHIQYVNISHKTEETRLSEYNYNQR